MKHSEAEDEFTETAALYALGMLDENEARVFEDHLVEGCEFCSRELTAYEAVVSDLGFSAEMESPSDEARERLSTRIASEAPRAKKAPESALSSFSKMMSIRTGELAWHEVNAGIFIKRLSVDEESGLATSLVKMGPGKRLARHRHNGPEQLFILEGDCYIQDVRLGPGDYHKAEEGSIHDSTYTIGGTTFLLIAPVTYEFLD